MSFDISRFMSRTLLVTGFRGVSRKNRYCRNSTYRRSVKVGPSIPEPLVQVKTDLNCDMAGDSQDLIEVTAKSAKVCLEALFEKPPDMPQIWKTVAHF